MSRPLFRRQALERVVTQRYGTVILSRPFSQGFLTVMFVSLAMAIVAFFILFTTTRKAHAHGVLLPNTGVVRVLPAQTGVITAKSVHEGQQVRVGEVMFVLSSDRSSSTGDPAQKAISVLLERRLGSFNNEVRQSAEQAQQRIAAFERKIANMRVEIQKLMDQIVLQQQRVSLSEQAFKRYSDLETTRFISAAQLQDKQADLLDQRQRLADLERNRVVGEREVSTALADMQNLEIQSLRESAALRRSASAVQQDLTDNEARREILVRAPQDGVVTAITAETGQTVASNQQLAVILPAGAELEAEIYVPSRSVGFIKPGLGVLLRYQAYPYQKFGQHAAEVREVSSTSLRPDDLAMPGVALSQGSSVEPLYRVRLRLKKQSVRVYGQEISLRSGMLVDASIVLEQRKLYEWVLEPLFSVAGRI